jgi:acyl transferase domain-containing protein
MYATVQNAKSNNDGYKEEGILHPCGDTHKLLLDECYQECGTDKNLIEYFEGHGTGTRVSTDKGQIKASFHLGFH